MKTDTHQAITDTIIAAIEAGETSDALPWRHADGLPRRVTNGAPYRGVNILSLWATATMRGYTSPYWGGFGSWKALGGHVRRGEKAALVVYSRPIEKDNGRGEIETVRLSRSYRVFNRDQIEGLPEEPVPPANTLNHSHAAVDTVTALCHTQGVTLVHRGASAFYTPSSDTITMPLQSLFTGTDRVSAEIGYACTLGHELIHATGHEHRCNRALSQLDRDSYAAEELVAEIGAAFLAAQLGFRYDGVAEHAGYIAGWLQALKNDKRAIFTASRLADAAVDYLLPPDTHGLESSACVAATPAVP